MKRNIFKFIFAIAAVGSILSCKKFLDKQPITEKGTEFVFSSTNSTFHALCAVYAQLAGDQGYGKVLSLYFPVDNDETQGPTGALDNARRDISRYALTPSNTEIQRPFEQCFRGIEYANICIANIPKMDLYSSGSDQEKAQLKRMYGEALTLRAQFYFDAIKVWGDLPAHFEPASVLATKDPFPYRVNRDSLYDKILADLLEAESLVPWAGEISAIGDQPDERITKGTVKGLRARIALFSGGYALRQNGQMERRSNYQDYYRIAKQECEEIISSNKHGLNPSFKNLWKNQVGGRVSTDPHNELMFQVGSIGASAVADSKLGYYNGPTVNAFGNKSINILPTFFYAFDSMDIRRDVTCVPYTVGSDGATKTAVGPTAIVDGKYRRDWISNPVVAPTDAAQYFSLKWQLLRYSDILLMFAEAENELNGPTAAAYSAVNKVRRRGFGVSMDAVSVYDLPAGLSRADFFNALIKERSFELAGEGLRKWDLIRWNLLAQKLSDTKLALADLQNRVGRYTDYPTSMYYKTGTTADDGTIWANSLYGPAPSSSSPPPNSTRISWIGTSITSTILVRYASNFVAGKSELFPIPQASRGANFNLTQNPNY